MSLSRIDALLRDIEAQRRILDHNLSKPARWRGPLRRELSGRPAPSERARVASAFDSSLGLALLTDIPFDVPFLQAAHDNAVGGFEFRTTGACIRYGDDYSLWRPPPSRSVPELAARALERAADGLEPPALAAARLHLELLLIHPFSDGNGRAVRLLSSLLLIRAGYRSTLFTAVEQHFSENQRAYTKVFIDLGNCGGTDHWPWLVTALEAMAAHSRLAFLHRTGEWSLDQDDAKNRRDLEAQLARITAEENDETVAAATNSLDDLRTLQS